MKRQNPWKAAVLAADADTRSKYRKVADELRDNILSGRYAPGKPFPSVKMLCRRFRISHLTAVKALETLKGMGLVRSRNGVGTFVSQKTKLAHGAPGRDIPPYRSRDIPPLPGERNRHRLRRHFVRDVRQRPRRHTGDSSVHVGSRPFGRDLPPSGFRRRLEGRLLAGDGLSAQWLVAP